MTTFFDDLTREIQVSNNLDTTVALENSLVGVVSYAVGDREFPDDLRQKILDVIATRRIDRPETKDRNEKMVEWFNAIKQSKLVEDLHGCFHVVAEGRHETRFGILTDNPLDILKRRDAHDEAA